MGLSKICFKCNKVKPLTDYYKHKKMGDGHLNKCKDCTKAGVKARHDELLKDPTWVEKEQKRHREKYYRLEYKEKHKPTADSKKRAMTKFWEKYPEKYSAKIKAGGIKSVLGHNHHWSYNDEHYKDVIDITPKDHAKAHRFIIYDQERKMYRKVGTFELLDTKEKHLEWIKFCIETKED
jgi:hypothetical protein